MVSVEQEGARYFWIINIQQHNTMNTLEQQDTSFWNRLFAKSLEHNRYGIIAMILLIVGCMGGIVMWSGGASQISQLFLTVFPTMATLTLLLADQPMRWIMTAASIAVTITYC